MNGRLSMRGAFAIIVLVQISNSIILGYPGSGGTDTWISMLISAVIITPLMLLYARLIHLMPGKDLFGMMRFAFGKWGNCIISAFYAFYFLTLAGIIRGNYAEFIHLTSLFNTSFTIICLAFFIVCVYLSIKGTRTLGNWCFIMLVLSLVSIGALILFSVNDIHVENLLPLNQRGSGELIINALKFIPLPLAESVMVLSIVGNLQRKVNPYKLFVFGTLTSVGFFIVLFLQNCAVLGWDTLKAMYFPSYKAASVVHVGSIGTRIESIMSFVFILAGISKVTLGLISGAKAVQNVFFLRNHKPLLLSVGFFSVALSVIAFENIMQMFDFMNPYMYYAVPFQILIPLVLWVIAEIKTRKKGIEVTAYWKNKQVKESG